MTMRWTSLVLTVSWLGACASAWAQMPPAPCPEGPPQSVPEPPAPPQSAPELPAPPVPADCGTPHDAAVCATVDGCVEPQCAWCPHVQVGLEYLLWYTRGQHLPPLVTAGSLSDPDPAALGQSHTSLLFGGDGHDSIHHNGVRLTLGVGLDDDSTWSVAGSLFGLERRAVSREFAANGAAGTPVIGRPFFNLTSNAEDADPVAIPNIATGAITIETPSQLYGGNLDVRWLCWCDECSRISFLLGGRYLSLDEALNISESSQDLPGQGVQGNSYQLAEDFVTHNRFYGGEFGAAYEWRFGPVVADLDGTVAYGPVRQTVHTSAFTSITEPSGIVTTSTDRALYVSPDNAGRFTHTRFAVVPEGHFKLGFDLNQYVRLTLGYSFLYLSEAARPGDQVDRNVNIQPVGTSTVFGTPLPPPGPQSSGYWAQGFDAGLRFSY